MMDYLRQRGVSVRGPEPLPEDPYTVARRSLSQQQRKQHTTKSQRDKLWRFLRYDRHVLRFFCVEDGPVDPRHRKKLVLQYFLVDDTLDLKELHRPLEQRELAPILLGRQRVPKVQESRGLFHVYETDGEGEEYIGPEDLLPGRRLNLYGRSFLIYDCDDFTKNFYRENFGTDNFDVVDVDVRDEERPTQPIPPYNGFGSPEDTLQRNSRQALEKEGIVLRFQATLLLYTARVQDSAVPLDKERSFVICFYPSDETVSILERPLPNSGMPGGKFLRRMRLRKPAQPGTAAMEPHYYDLSDFRVGNVLEAVGRRFVLVRADQFAASYIKRHQLDALTNGRLSNSFGRDQLEG
ncbi:hypothetical protein HPB48_015397 [Haemaphysalis longicornis]|uniref:DM10 domain-containing protein n=1 Tax=Haemaphysalis longicornis TaxID=44386 RepID=A0A9J6H3L4_HAELO|nr:hypothetical protein HPB48_015397 [Haemaphysalis longicornis]